MAAKFSDMEQSIIQNMILVKSHRVIAALLDRSVGEVSAFISTVTGGTDIVTKQMKLDSKPGRKRTELKSQAIVVKQQNLQAKEQKRRNLVERQNIERERINLRRLPGYKTREVDYSQLITVMIDRRTAIYVRPGDNVEAAKKLYLKKVEAQKLTMIAKNAKPKYNRLGKKICTRCETEKGAENFNNNRLCPDGKEAICKNCKETMRQNKLKENIFRL